jgi:hypothetical protein
MALQYSHLMPLTKSTLVSHVPLEALVAHTIPCSYSNAHVCFSISFASYLKFGVLRDELAQFAASTVSSPTSSVEFVYLLTSSREKSAQERDFIAPKFLRSEPSRSAAPSPELLRRRIQLPLLNPPPSFLHNAPMNPLHSTLQTLTMNAQRLGLRLGRQLRSPAFRSTVQRRLESSAATPKPKQELTGIQDNAFNRERAAVKSHAAATSGTICPLQL